MYTTVTNIGSANGVGAQSVTVPTAGVPAGAHIIVIGCDNGTGSLGNSNGTATDSAGNTYSSIATIPVGTGVELSFLRSRSGNGGGLALVSGNTVTYTPGTGGTVCSVSVFWVSGLAATGSDNAALGTNSGTSSSPTVTSGSPTGRGEFFIAAVAGSTLITTYNQDNSWSSPPGIISTAAPVLGGGNQINAGSGALTYAPTFDTSDNWVAAVLPLFVSSAENYDQPNPSLAKNYFENRSWNQTILPELVGKDTFFTSAGRGPTYDYPNPRGQIPNISLGTHIDPLKLNLRSKDTFFNGPGKGPTYAYPNPWGPTPDIVLKTITESYDVELVGKDKFFGAPGMGPTYSYPTPRGAIPPSVLNTWIYSSLGLKYGFTNVTRYPTFHKYVVSFNPTLYTWGRGPTSPGDTFFGLAGNPSFYWPNPISSVPSISLKTWTQYSTYQTGL